MLILYNRGNTIDTPTKNYLDSIGNEGGVLKNLSQTEDMISALSTYNAWMVDPQLSGYITNKNVLVSKHFSIGQNLPLSQATDTLQPLLGDFTQRKSIVRNQRFASASTGYASASIAGASTTYNTLEIGFTVLPKYVVALDDPSDSTCFSTGARASFRFLNVFGSMSIFIQGDNGGVGTTILNVTGSAPANFQTLPVIFYKFTINYTTLAYTWQYSTDGNSFTVLNSGSVSAAFRTLITDIGVNVDLRAPGNPSINSTIAAYIKLDGSTVATFNPYDCALNASSWTDSQSRSWSIVNHSGNNPVGGFVQTRNSLFFNGTTQYLSGPSDSFYTLTGDFLISAVIKPSLWDASNSRMALLSTAIDSSASSGFMLEFGSADGFRLLNNGATVLDDNVSSITGLTPKINHYVRIQRSGTGSNNLQIYVDDVLRGQASYNSAIGSGNTIYFGANSAAQAGTTGFTGEIPSLCLINGTWDSTIAGILRRVQTQHYQAV